MMSIEEIEHRLIKAEGDIETLFGRTNEQTKELAEVTIKLDNILVTLGELKESLAQLQSRPGTMWDKLISGIIGAAATAIVAYILK
jgi:hypothetical protein